MKEISCNVIQDLLPLYVDDVVSKETEALVEEHLTHCPKCQKEVAQMKRNLSFPIEKKAPLMQGLSKKWRSKNRMIAGISVLLTSLILFGIFYFIFYFDRLIPYSDSLIKIEKQENGYLSAHYYGDNYFSISATEPMSVIVDGQEKKQSFYIIQKLLQRRTPNNSFKTKVVAMKRILFFRWMTNRKLMSFIMPILMR